VNLEGTRNVLDFAERGGHLARFQYVSTCYVSGRHPGTFTEADLELGQAFNNFYEETKYLAEVEVRRRVKGGFPATIYRPAITVGDSATGATQKYDGPYFIIQWVLRQMRVALVPTVGDLSTYVNVVPRDFVVTALAHLAGLEASRGKTYQLADPSPLRVSEMLDELERATGKRLVKIPLPLNVAKVAIRRVPGVYELMRIPADAIDYFAHPTRYDTRNTQADLAGSGIACPPFPAYVDRLVAFVRAHPECGSSAMA
jgi:nucleoside-diphosphate-sugar epimerase